VNRKEKLKEKFGVNNLNVLGLVLGKFLNTSS
jgi:hypothetical protein